MGKSKNKKKGVFGKKGTAVQWVVILAVILMVCSAVPKNEETASTVPTAAQETFVSSDEISQESTSAEGSLEVHFIDVGQGDSTLVICDGHALLIDAGSNDKGTTVQLYLKKHDVEYLDAVIWTHPDADHIGGADVITTKFDIGTVYMSSASADTKAYEELIDAIDYRNYSITTPSVGSSFELGQAAVTFLGPSTTYDDNENNNSIVCMIQFGNNKFLFTGDAEEEAENELVRANNDLSADVYKVGHHGSRTASSKTFLNVVNPTYAVISCGENNTYGHPHSEVLNNLRDMGVKVFRTDEQGSIIATSDGSNITWNTVPSDTWQAGETFESSSTESGTAADISSVNSAYGTAPAGAVYIGNTNNQKLHKASCSGLPQSQNQVLFDTLEAASAAGYTKDNQCKRCYPYGK
jgi:competence protein ComEC